MHQYCLHSRDFGEDLCHAHPWVREQLERWGDWLVETVGYDGFRLDFVKGIERGFVGRWLSSGLRAGRFAVG